MTNIFQQHGYAGRCLNRHATKARSVQRLWKSHYLRRLIVERCLMYPVSDGNLQPQLRMLFNPMMAETAAQFAFDDPVGCLCAKKFRQRAASIVT